MIYWKIYFRRLAKTIFQSADTMIGRLFPLQPVLDKVNLRPFDLHYELANICNANCIFCGYQYQKRPKEIMPYHVFEKTLSDYIEIGGGNVTLTPIVGDALIDPNFLNRIIQLRKEPSIGKIRVITNGILLDRFGFENIVTSGLDEIYISTAGFQKEMYERIYRNSFYERMRDNVLNLLKSNSKTGSKVKITIILRADRPLKEVLRDRDFQSILAYGPEIHFTYYYDDFNGRIKESDLKGIMKLRKVVPKKVEACEKMYRGPIVLPNGVVLACFCAVAMDAVEDLLIGNILQNSLYNIWAGEKRKSLVEQFGKDTQLNSTCAPCTAYRNLDLYWSFRGRLRAQKNRSRFINRFPKKPAGIWQSNGKTTRCCEIFDNISIKPS